MLPSNYIEALIAAADAAGDAIRPWFRAGVAADQKSDESPVTIADREAERAIRAVLTRHFPDHGRLGEEEGLENPGAALRWVFDPIDGTRAFITGRPTFGTLIALLRDETPILGLIDQPITGERWIGVTGERTSFRGPYGGVPGTRRCPALGAAELSATSPQMFDATDHARFTGLGHQVRRVSWGGDCYAYGLLALGQIDLIAEATMKIWDWAALVPVIEGAGGRITDWQGRTLTAASSGHVLAAGDAGLIDQAIAILG